MHESKLQRGACGGWSIKKSYAAVVGTETIVPHETLPELEGKDIRSVLPVHGMNPTVVRRHRNEVLAQQLEQPSECVQLF